MRWLDGNTDSMDGITQQCAAVHGKDDNVMVDGSWRAVLFLKLSCSSCESTNLAFVKKKSGVKSKAN